MAQFTLYKQNDSKVHYRLAGSNSSVRFPRKMFASDPPATLEIPGDYVATSGGGFAKTPLPPDVQAAKDKLKAFQAEEKARREAAMTPEQREKRDQKRKEKEAAKAAKKAAAAPPAPTGPVAAGKAVASGRPANRR